jgi:hypothetical protein
MHEHNITPSSWNGTTKDKHFEGQMRRVFAAFYKQPKTMLMTNPELFPSIVEPSNTVKL